MKDKVKYALLFVAIKALAIWPYWVLHTFSSLLYPFVYHVARYRRKVTRKNLLQAFSEKSQRDIVKIEKAFYRHFCDYLFETIKLMHISDEQMRRHLRFTNAGILESLRTDGRPIFLYLGHQGNWEYVISISLWIHPDLKGVQVYHPLRNKTMDRLMYRLRSRFNTVGVPQKQALRYIIEQVRAGRPIILGLIADQRPPRRPEPEWMTFLHQDTPIITGGEAMGRKLDAHFLYGSMKCVRRGYYEITLQEIKPVEGENCSYSKQYMRMLEQDIKAQPHMWLWTHNRWSMKRQ